MRQILLKDRGVLVARMPRPSLEPGAVLVRVHHSLISVGTEIAPLRSVWASLPGGTTGERIPSVTTVAQKYLRKAPRNPGKAGRKVLQYGGQATRHALDRLFLPRSTGAATSDQSRVASP